MVSKDVGEKLKDMVKNDARQNGFVELAERVPLSGVQPLTESDAIYPYLDINKNVPGLEELGDNAVIECEVKVTRLEDTETGRRICLRVKSIRRKE